MKIPCYSVTLHTVNDSPQVTWRSKVPTRGTIHHTGVILRRVWSAVTRRSPYMPVVSEGLQQPLDDGGLPGQPEGLQVKPQRLVDTQALEGEGAAEQGGVLSGPSCTS